MLLVLLLTVSALGLASWTWQSGRDEPLLPIRYVRVEGALQNLDVGQLRMALLPTVSTGYFALDIREIEAVARSFPWVDGIQVARRWPDTLVLRISEHKPVAHWGDHAFLNQRGERFEPGGVEAYPDLPVIYGPPGMENYLLGMLKRLNDKLAIKHKGMSITSLDLSRRRAWIARLASGMEIHFGRQDPLQALERFLELVPKLGEDKMAHILHVDLRYPNGFAVVWKPAEAGDAGNLPKETGFHLIGKASHLALETIN